MVYDNVKYIERPPVFMAQRFDADNPIAIIKWLRDNMTDGFVGFHFDRGDEIDEAMPARVLHIGRGSTEITVRDGHWVVRNWPGKGRDVTPWSVLSEEDFKEFFVEDPYQDIIFKAAE